MAGAGEFFGRGKGHGARSSIIALKDNVNLKYVVGQFLLKAGDRLDYDFNVWEALSSSRARHRLKSLEHQGVVKIEVTPKSGSANQRQVDQRLAAKREDRRRREERRRLLKKQQQEQEAADKKRLAVAEEARIRRQQAAEAKKKAEAEAAMKADAELESKTSVEEMVQVESTTSQSLPDANPDKPGVQVEVDLDELRTSIESQLTDIHGVSRKQANQILDLESWDRQAVDDIRYMRSENIPTIMEIIEPHRKTFGK